MNVTFDMDHAERMMRRALQLAACGRGFTSPNPMVGAVIEGPDGRILGEGYHRRYGGPHAEVNAVNSVRQEDRHLLRQSTIYVSLEPCAHYGKTPPCAKLLIDCGFPRVVVGTADPFSKVGGRGIAMLREAGAEVVMDVLRDECRAINAPFFTAHTLGRPFVTLKWAQSIDGYMDSKRDDASRGAVAFSTPLSSTLMHSLRACHDGILIGAGTVRMDRPRLDTRLRPGGRAPRPIILGHMDMESFPAERQAIIIQEHTPVAELLVTLYKEYGMTSVMVEGGANILTQFINEGLWDIARVEVSPLHLGAEGGPVAPHLPTEPFKAEYIDSNVIYYHSNNPLADSAL